MTDFAAALFRPASRRSISALRYLDLYRQRRALASLDEAALLDIGLTRDIAAKEAARPMWDAPDHWS